MALASLSPLGTRVSELDATQRHSAVLLLFATKDCGPCELMAPIIDDVAELCRVRVVPVDPWEQPSLVARLRILSLPTCVLIVDGVEKTRFAGTRRKRWILGRLARHLDRGRWEATSVEDGRQDRLPA